MWSRRAERYDAFYRRYGDARRDAWTAAVATWLGDDPRRVLDVGTGTGFLSTTLAALGHDVVAVDASARMLEHARTEAGRRRVAPAFVHGSADEVDRLPDLRGGVDVVTARYVLWTLPDPVAALRAWRAVLRPGGTLLVADGMWRPRRPDPRGVVGLPGVRGRLRLARDRVVLGRHAPHWRGLDAATASDLLAAAGFTATRRVEDVLPVSAWPVAEDFFVLRAG